MFKAPKTTDADKIKNGCARISHSKTGTARLTIKIYIKNSCIALRRARYAKQKIMYFSKIEISY